MHNLSHTKVVISSSQSGLPCASHENQWRTHCEHNTYAGWILVDPHHLVFPVDVHLGEVRGGQPRPRHDGPRSGWKSINLRNWRYRMEVSRCGPRHTPGLHRRQGEPRREHKLHIHGLQNTSHPSYVMDGPCQYLFLISFRTGVSLCPCSRVLTDSKKQCISDWHFGLWKTRSSPLKNVARTFLFWELVNDTSGNDFVLHFNRKYNFMEAKSFSHVIWLARLTEPIPCSRPRSTGSRGSAKEASSPSPGRGPTW